MLQSKMCYSNKYVLLYFKYDKRSYFPIVNERINFLLSHKHFPINKSDSVKMALKIFSNGFRNEVV